MNLETQIPPQARAALEDCFAKIRFARATDLAQSERFLEAEALLTLNGELPGDPRELDLLARIAAAQHRFNDARHLWSLALQRQPENETYRGCLKYLTPSRKFAWFLARLLNKVFYLSVWVAIAFGIGALVFTFLL